jgi:hypothetical protein
MGTTPMDELQRAPRMTVDEILEHIRALPLPERRQLIECILKEFAEDVPSTDEESVATDEAAAAPARGNLEKR